MVNIRKNIVAGNLASKVTYNGTNAKTYIVIHETANTNKGANADAHGRLQANGNSRASWHYSVDDNEAVQSFSDSAQCWHAGNSTYNRNAIGIEICVNSDGNYKKAVSNAAELVKSLMDKYSIPAKNVVQHHTASGKDCPHFMRAGSKGITWVQFKAMLTGSTADADDKPAASKPAAKPSGSLGLVDWMKSKDMNSSFNNRKKLAGQYGISNYSGTAAQNTKLLAKLQAGKPTTSTTSKKGNQTTSSIVDYLKTINVNSGYANRKKLAAKHGIKNYSGTASQNAQLLKKMRG